MFTRPLGPTERILLGYCVSSSSPSSLKMAWQQIPVAFAVLNIVLVSDINRTGLIDLIDIRYLAPQNEGGD